MKKKKDGDQEKLYNEQSSHPVLWHKNRSWLQIFKHAEGVLDSEI